MYLLDATQVLHIPRYMYMCVSPSPLTSCAAALRLACSSLKHSRFLKGPSNSSFS